MSDEEGDDEVNKMRQMMGFSSFGTSQRSKKEPKEPTTGEFSASGANSAPLAKRAKTINMKSKIQPLSSPPTFWPASLPPPPKSTASIRTYSSTQSYSSASEQQQTPGASPILPSSQDSWYAPPPGIFPGSASLHDARYAPTPPGVTIQSQSPQEQQIARSLGPSAYKNLVSGISFTRQELGELKAGKRNEKGDLVFFQPSFVDPDPWAGLKKKTVGERAGYGERRTCTRIDEELQVSARQMMASNTAEAS